MNLTILLLALAPLVADGESDANADSILVSYDLTAVSPTFDAVGFLETLLLSSGNGYPGYSRTNLQNLYESEGSDAVVDLVTRFLSEELEYEGREISMQSANELLVLAPPSVQAKVRGALAAIEEALSAAVEIQVDVVSLPAGTSGLPDASVVDAGQLEGLLGGVLARAGSRESFRLRVSAGRTSVLEMSRAIPVVSDYDIEIAQGALIHDPIVGMAEVGTRLFLRAAPAKGGLALSVYYSHGEALRDEPLGRELQLRSLVAREDGVDYIDGPVLEQSMEILCRSVAFDTLLSEGKALLIQSEVDLGGEKSRQLLALRKVGGGLDSLHLYTSGGARQILLINTEAFHPPSLTIGGNMLGQDEGHARIPELTAALRKETALFLYDWVGSRFSTWRPFGPWLLCVYDPSWDGEAAAKLEGLLEGWGGDTQVADVSITLRSRVGDGSVPASWILPVRSGGSCAGLLGISSTDLQDYDVEVAQFAAGPDPVHQPVFSGLAFSLHSSSGGSNDLILDLEATAHLQAGPRRSIELGGPIYSRLSQTVFDKLVVQERLRVPAAEGSKRFVLGDRTPQGVAPALALEIGVR